ncbi:MAG: DMT family transporter [Pseudomonadota bacterium]
MTPDRPALGLMLMIAFCVLAPLADALAKVIGDRVPLVQLVAVRFAAQAVIFLPLVGRGGGRLFVATARHRLWGLMVVRTGLMIAGIGLMFLSLRVLPLADAIAIAYVMPFIVLALGWLVLGEAVGWWRIGASVVGFLGTLLVMQPSFAEVGLVVLMPLGVALIFAVFILITRAVSAHIGAVELQALNGLIGTALLLPLLVLAEGTGWAEVDPVWPDGRIPGLMLAMAVVGTISHLALTASLQVAPAATVAPVQYLEIPCAALLGWAIFAEFPDGVALVGIALVMGAGLVVILRERATAMAARPGARGAPPPAPPAAG